MTVVALIVYAVVAAGLYYLWRHTTRPTHDGSIVFKDPRVKMPGERLAEFRHKKALANPQAVEGNDLPWKFGYHAKDYDCQVSPPQQGN